MDHSKENEQIPTGVLIDVTKVIGESITSVSRLSSGLHVGATLVQLSSGGRAVLKVVSLEQHPQQMEDLFRAQRIVRHMRGLGYPTPEWLGVGASGTHIWQLMEFVDATPVSEFTQSLVEQMMEIVEIQAGQAKEEYDHWAYSWRVVSDLQSDVAKSGYDQTSEQTMLRRSIAKIHGYSTDVKTLVERITRMCSHVSPPPKSLDMVHADLNPSNVLVRDGSVVAVVDIGNAGSGTRATDLIDLVWYSFQDHLDCVRKNVWLRIFDLVARDQAAVLAGTKILHMLEFNTRSSDDKGVRVVVERGNVMLDDLDALG